MGFERALGRKCLCMKVYVYIYIYVISVSTWVYHCICIWASEHTYRMIMYGNPVFPALKLLSDPCPVIYEALP